MNEAGALETSFVLLEKRLNVLVCILVICTREEAHEKPKREKKQKVYLRVAAKACQRIEKNIRNDQVCSCICVCLVILHYKSFTIA